MSHPVTHTAQLGALVIRSLPGIVENLPGHIGAAAEASLRARMPPKRAPFTLPSAAPLAPPIWDQVDGRTTENVHTWSGLRFLMRADALTVKPGETEIIYFTTHLGNVFNGVPTWTEIGFRAGTDQTGILFYTWDSQQTPAFQTHGAAQLGRWYEFAIRLNESDSGPWRYETVVDGIRVRTGTLPCLDNQVDVSHESFSLHGNPLSKGDYVMAEQGWLDFPPARARWYAPDIDTTTYSTDAAKTVRLFVPPGQTAYRFESRT